jgi:hypothetical protein
VKRRAAAGTVIAAALVAAGPATPARTPSAVVVSKQRLYRVTVTPRPALSPVGRLHTWRLALRTAGEAAGEAPVDRATIRVRGDMPAHGHGLPTQPRVVGLGGGRYEVRGMKFQMGGHWYVEFRIAARPGRDVARIDFNLPM